MPKRLSDVISRITQQASKDPLLIAIDGPGGAGKSTLAAALQQHFEQVTIVPHDDFYRPMDEEDRLTLTARQGYYRYFDWGRLVSQVLIPLSQGLAGHYQRYDWRTEELEEWIFVPPHGIIIIKGVYTTRPELRTFYDLRLYVETDPAIRQQRQLEQAENSTEWIERWAAAEAYYERQHQPQQHVNLVVAGDEILNPGDTTHAANTQ